MNIKYRIIEVIESEHSFVVRFYTELITEEMLVAQFNDDGSIKVGKDGKPVRCRTDYNISLFDEYATEEDIDNKIRMSAPVDWLRIQEANLGRNTDTMSLAMGRALAKIHIEHEFEHKPPDIKQIKPEPSDAEIEALLAKFVKTNAK